MKTVKLNSNTMASIVGEATKAAANKASEPDAIKIGQCMQEAAESIGSLSVIQDSDKENTRKAVEQYVREAISAGLSCDKDGPYGDMLKAPSKNNEGQLWMMFVDALNMPRYASFAIDNDLEVDDLTEDMKAKAGFSASVRDNYLSRIREFVRGQGIEPLDLYGNFKQAKLAASRKASQGKDNETKPDNKTAAGSNAKNRAKPSPVRVIDLHEDLLVGITPLAAFLQKWIKANPKNVAKDKDVVLIAAAEDLLHEIEDAAAKQTKKAKK